MHTHPRFPTILESKPSQIYNKLFKKKCNLIKPPNNLGTYFCLLPNAFKILKHLRSMSSKGRDEMPLTLQNTLNMDILHKTSGGPPRWLEDWRTDILGCWENWVCSALRKKKMRRDNYCTVTERWLSQPLRCSEHKSRNTGQNTENFN